MGWLCPGVNAYVVCPDIPTPFSIGDGPSGAPAMHVMCLFPHSFAVEGSVELLKFGVQFLKFHLSLTFFPFRLRRYRLFYL